MFYILFGTNLVMLRLFLPLYLEMTPGRLKGLRGMLGVEPGLQGNQTIPILFSAETICIIPTYIRS